MMQIQRIQGRDLEDALNRARETCGDEAVVLSQEADPTGGVLLSVTRRTTSVGGKTVKPLRPRAVDAATGNGLRPDDLAEVRQRLGEAGCTGEFVERVLTPVARLAGEGMHPIDATAEVLGRLLPIAELPKRSRALRTMALVGPTGAGKTTSLAKLAVVLLHAGRRVALATTDTYRVGAVDQLRAYAEVLQVPLYVANGGDELAATVAAAKDCDVLLVDTAGRSPRDTESLTRLARDLERAGRETELDSYPVLPAAAGAGALRQARLAYAVLDPRATILTKLDETREVGTALEFCLRHGLETAFLCDGQDVHQNIHRATPGRLADLCLRGRLA